MTALSSPAPAPARVFIAAAVLLLVLAVSSPWVAEAGRPAVLEETASKGNSGGQWSGSREKLKDPSHAVTFDDYADGGGGVRGGGGGAGGGASPQPKSSPAVTAHHKISSSSSISSTEGADASSSSSSSSSRPSPSASSAPGAPSSSSSSSSLSTNTPLGRVPPSNAEAVDVRFDVVIPDMSANLEEPLDPGEPLPERLKTLIWCKSFLVEAKEGEEANNVIGVEPMPGLPNVHHMHLHVCDPDSAAWKRHRRMYADVDDSQPGAPARGKLPLSCFPPSWERGSGCHGTAWTFLPGQSTVMFPPGVGMKIGLGHQDLRHLVLEVHYDMAHELAGVPDRSGIRLWAVQQPVVQHRMGVLSVADPFAKFPQDLPPGEPSVEVNIFCPPGCTQKFPTPVHVFASMTHAHMRARYVLTAVGTPGPDGQVPRGGWTDVVEASAAQFEHHAQHFEAVNFTIDKGDSLRTTCRYDTSQDTQPVHFGPATSDEMCMQVFLYWPKQYTFLCGYYGEKVYWCGDAGGFVRKTGTDARFHAESCIVGGDVSGVG
eukprot:CAMPEP_0197578112 /NCGR_PEP_ID=MMETSP1326-20131121/2476_1 /TAXON_ID=1155430 /ORGANISM="Genus nov. species nov., Strain RCC2288" /LENGTH=542 /DNA_ID=CAMNT_0043141271 /DNA_START=115 /DNA_END=1740 /DNA_ORIENTATION=+